MRDENGQSTVEWVGLVLLVALVFGGLIAAGVRVPGNELAGSILDRLICAAGLTDRCGASEGDLDAVYGEEIAEAVRAHAPALAFEDGVKWVPSDFRDCMAFECAESPGQGRISQSTTGEPITAFTRVVDCRDEPTQLLAARSSNQSWGEPDCGGKREGNLYLAYWFYYPDSATFEGVPVLEDAGFHLHDWESFQIRISPDGEADARASSHKSHNNRRSPANWAAEAGIEPVNAAAEWVGARPSRGWGPAGGWLSVTAGSHAGNVADARGRDTTYALPEDVRLIPLEQVVATSPEDLPSFSPIVPPWEKDLWTDPESAHTG